MKCLAFNIGPVTVGPNIGKIAWVVVHPLYGNCLCVLAPGADATGLAAQVNAYINSGIVVDVPTPGEATAIGSISGIGSVFQNAANVGPLPTNVASVPVV